MVTYSHDSAPIQESTAKALLAKRGILLDTVTRVATLHNKELKVNILTHESYRRRYSGYFLLQGFLAFLCKEWTGLVYGSSMCTEIARVRMSIRTVVFMLQTGSR